MYKIKPKAFIHGLKLKRWYRRARSDNTLPSDWTKRPALLVPDGDTLSEVMDRIYGEDTKYMLVNDRIVRRAYYGA